MGSCHSISAIPAKISDASVELYYVNEHIMSLLVNTPEFKTIYSETNQEKARIIIDLLNQTGFRVITAEEYIQETSKLVKTYDYPHINILKPMTRQEIQDYNANIKQFAYCNHIKYRQDKYQDTSIVSDYTTTIESIEPDSDTVSVEDCIISVNVNLLDIKIPNIIEAADSSTSSSFIDLGSDSSSSQENLHEDIQ